MGAWTNSLVDVDAPSLDIIARVSRFFLKFLRGKRPFWLHPTRSAAIQATVGGARRRKVMRRLIQSGGCQPTNTFDRRPRIRATLRRRSGAWSLQPASYHVSQDAGPKRGGQTLKRTVVEIGTPSPWFHLAHNLDERTFHAFRINYFASSVGIGLIGFLFYGASWQIEKALAAATGKQLRWWHGSPNVVLIAWASMVFSAVLFGTHPLYLNASN